MYSNRSQADLLARRSSKQPDHWAPSYGFAVAATILAILLRDALSPAVDDELPYLTLYPAVILSAALGGGGAGLFSLALGALATALSVADAGLSPWDAGPLASLIVFLSGGAASVAAAAMLRRNAGRLDVMQEQSVAALEASGTGTWRWDIGSDAMEWDPALVRLFGLEPSQAPRTRSDSAA